MDWIPLKKKPPEKPGQYLIHCIGVNIQCPCQIGNWNGKYFWTIQGQIQMPMKVISGDQVTQSLEVDYYAIIEPVLVN